MSASSRASPYVAKPDAHWLQLREQLDDTTFFMVSRHGPLIFSIKDENDNLCKVVIGNPHNCSACGNKKMCLHIMFCVLKVLKVSEEFPVAFMMSFTDSEINNVLSGTFGKLEPVRRRTRAAVVGAAREGPDRPTSAAANEDGFVHRQEISEDEPDCCPICQEDVTNDRALTWCRKGCGHNMHAKCMQTYLQYKISTNLDPECPFCRTVWSMDHLKADLRKHEPNRMSLNVPCRIVHCSACILSIRGLFFRCIECSQQAMYRTVPGSTASLPSSLHLLPRLVDTVAPSINDNNGTTDAPSAAAVTPKPIDFCHRCFESITRPHATHHFVSSDANAKMLEEVTWLVAHNPRQPKRVVSEELLHELQTRELNDADYDLLLNFDRSHLPPMPNHIVDALPTVEPILLQAIRAGRVPGHHSCWCCTGETHDDTNVRLLQCQHVAHAGCLQPYVAEAVDNDVARLDQLVCPHEGCGKRILRCFVRAKGKRRKSCNVIANEQQPSFLSTGGLSASSISGGHMNHQIVTGSTLHSNRDNTNGAGAGLGVAGAALTVTGLGGIGALPVSVAQSAGNSSAMNHSRQPGQLMLQFGTMRPSPSSRQSNTAPHRDNGHRDNTVAHSVIMEELSAGIAGASLHVKSPMVYPGDSGFGNTAGRSIVGPMVGTGRSAGVATIPKRLGHPLRTRNTGLTSGHEPSIDPSGILATPLLMRSSSANDSTGFGRPVPLVAAVQQLQQSVIAVRKRPSSLRSTAMVAASAAAIDAQESAAFETSDLLRVVRSGATANTAAAAPAAVLAAGQLLTGIDSNTASARRRDIRGPPQPQMAAASGVLKRHRVGALAASSAVANKLHLEQQLQLHVQAHTAQVAAEPPVTGTVNRNRDGDISDIAADPI